MSASYCPIAAFAEAVLHAVGALEAAASGYSHESPPPDGMLLWYEGEPAMRQNSAPPRIVWYSGDINPDDPFKRDGGEDPSAWSGLPEIYFHVWGRDRDESWILHEMLLAKVRVVGGYDATWRGTRSTRMSSGEMDLGVAYLARITISVPIRDEAAVLADITSFNLTGTAIIGGVEYQATNAG